MKNTMQKRFRIGFSYHGREFHQGVMTAPRGCSTLIGAEQWFLANYCTAGSLYSFDWVQAA